MPTIFVEGAQKRRQTREEQAESFLELAREEAAVGYSTDDHRRVRDSAEKTWLSVCEAVNASMERRGKSPPVGRKAHSERRNFLEAIDRGLAAELSLFADKLHGDCFYDGDCPTKEAMRTDMTQAEQFIRRVKALK